MSHFQVYMLKITPMEVKTTHNLLKSCFEMMVFTQGHGCSEKKGPCPSML